MSDKLRCKCQKYDIGNSECTVHTVTVSVGSDCHRHVTEVMYDIGNSGSYSECTVHTVTVSVGSDSYRRVTQRSCMIQVTVEVTVNVQYILLQ